MTARDFGGKDFAVHNRDGELRRRLEVLDSELQDAESEFHESRPNFSSMNRLIETITHELREYTNDFGTLLREDPQYGGGLDDAERRIENMKRALVKLKEAVAEAEKLLEANKDYEPFRKQVQAARRAVGVLERL